MSTMDEAASTMVIDGFGSLDPSCAITHFVRFFLHIFAYVVKLPSNCLAQNERFRALFVALLVVKPNRVWLHYQ